MTRLRLIAHGFAWGLLLVLLALLVPRVEAIFVDYGIPQPRLTILAIRASHLVIVLASLILVLLGAD